MTGPDASEQLLQERLRQERRTRNAGILGVVVLVGVLVAFMTPWLLGLRQVTGRPHAVATMRDSRCWNSWVVESDGTTWQIGDAPDSWLGSGEVRGEVAVHGDGPPTFFTESGEEHLLAVAAGGSTCTDPPTTPPLR